MTKKRKKKENSNRWSEHEIEVLRSGYANARFAQEISDELGRSLKSVYSKAIALGIKSPYKGWSAKGMWTPEEDEAMKQMVREGRSTTYIGEKIGRTASAVKDRRKKLGILPPSKIKVQEQAIDKDGYFVQVWVNQYPKMEITGPRSVFEFAEAA